MTFVSLNPCLDALLVELAPSDRILALSHYSERPGGSRIDPSRLGEFSFTGGTAEEILALEPDVVLASVFLAPATRSALERSGVRIEAFDSPRTVADSVAQLARMGDLAGNPDGAASLARAIETPVWSSEATDANRPNPSLLLWQPGQIVAGQETLISQLIREEGFTSQAAELGLAQADYVTLEGVLNDPPDLLLVAGNSAGQSHPALSALKDTQVHAFDPQLFNCGGASVLDARRELHALRASFEAPQP